MRLIDFNGTHCTRDAADLDRLLSPSSNDRVNELLMSHEPDDYPLLTVLLKDNSAALFYTPADGDAGFASVGQDADSREMTIFSTGSAAQQIQVSNRAVVPISLALIAAKEFMVSVALPKSLSWLRL
jgi:hypothetical protein